MKITSKEEKERRQGAAGGMGRGTKKGTVVRDEDLYFPENPPSVGGGGQPGIHPN
jgi:hypothetical protein